MGIPLSCLVLENAVCSLELPALNCDSTGLPDQDSSEMALGFARKLCKVLGHGAEMDPPEIIDRVIRVVVPTEGLEQDQLYLNQTPVPSVIRLVFR